MQRLIQLMILAVLSLSVANCGASGPPTPQAVKYDLIKRDDNCDITYPRKRCSVFIYSDVQDFDARAQTALRAAIDTAQNENADFAEAYLLPSRSRALTDGGNAVAHAAYAPDGGGIDGNSPLKHGTWEAEASNIKLSNVQLKILEYFYNIIDHTQRVNLFCRDKSEISGVEKLYARNLGISVEEFRQWEQSAKYVTVDNLHDTLDAIWNQNMDFMIASHCTCMEEDDDDAAKEKIAKLLDLKSSKFDIPIWTRSDYEMAR